MDTVKAKTIVAGYLACARNNHEPCTCGHMMSRLFGDPAKALTKEKLDEAFRIMKEDK